MESNLLSLCCPHSLKMEAFLYCYARKFTGSRRRPAASVTKQQHESKGVKAACQQQQKKKSLISIKKAHESLPDTGQYSLWCSCCLSCSLLGIMRAERAFCFLPFHPRGLQSSSQAPCSTTLDSPMEQGPAWEGSRRAAPMLRQGARGTGFRVSYEQNPKSRQSLSAFPSRISRWKRALPQLISRFLSSSLLCSFIFQRHHVPLHSKSTFQGADCWITSGDAVLMYVLETFAKNY